MGSAKVLILEDDVMLADALQRSLTGAGHNVSITSSPETALKMIDEKRISLVFVDCLLPGSSGVDFVEALRPRFPMEILNVVLMSGIFTDAQFMKESTRSTQAVAFLKKPFDLAEALKIVAKFSQNQAVSADSPRRLLYQTFSKARTSVREKRKLIEALDEVHGFDLPFIYSLLSESKISGHLNIIGANKEVSGVSFSQGNIVAVDVLDESTWLGKLLIEAGFISKTDLDNVLEVKSNRRIGERLIFSNLLSPHGFNVAAANQMNIRLSRTITNSPIKINFSESEVDLTTPHIDSEALLVFLHDWIASKITLDWLKTHYAQWESTPMVTGVQFGHTHPAAMMALVSSMNGLFEDLGKPGVTISSLLDLKKYPEGPLYKSIHFLMVRGLLVFSGASSALSSDDMQKLFKKIGMQFEGKNKLDVFDIMAQLTGVGENVPEIVYASFMDLFKKIDHPELQEKKRSIEVKAREAVNFAKLGPRDLLIEKIKNEEGQITLKAAGQFEEGKTMLNNGRFQEAYDLISKAIEVDANLPKIRLYLAWAKVGLVELGSRTVSRKDVEMDMLQISPEDKVDALYYLVWGILRRVSGDNDGARKSIDKSLALDGTFVAAKREATRFGMNPAPKKDMLNRDLKDLVGDMFSGKKR